MDGSTSQDGSAALDPSAADFLLHQFKGEQHGHQTHRPQRGCRPRARAGQPDSSIYNGTVYFAATPDRPFDPGASVAVQTQQMLKRVDERLALAGSDKSRILAAHVMLTCATLPK